MFSVAVNRSSQEPNVGGWQLFEGSQKWYNCPPGYVVGGFWKNYCQSLHCLEQMKCIRPDTPNIISQTCMELDIRSTFDNAGRVECPQNYFVAGIWSSDNSNFNCGLYCWETLRCCKYDEAQIVVSTTITPQNWWTCFDGSITRWCEVDNDRYITGFYRSGGQDLFNLEIAYTRQVYLFCCENRCRKEWSTLTQTERNLYRDAFKRLADQGVMQQLSQTHFVSADHFNSYFLPWHRAFVMVVEDRIRALGGNYTCFAMPFWYVFFIHDHIF